MPTKPVTMVEAELISAFKCGSCDGIFMQEDVDESGAIYECGECSSTWSAMENCDAARIHQCPQCNKFGARIADRSCPECGGSGCSDEPEEMSALLYQGSLYLPQEEA